MAKEQTSYDSQPDWYVAPPDYGTSYRPAPTKSESKKDKVVPEHNETVTKS